MRTAKKPDPPFDINSLIAGIMRVESNDDKYMINPTSSATVGMVSSSVRLRI